MSGHSFSLLLNTPDQTARAARALGSALSAGDTVLLSGEIGAGKTHFARALIQHMLLHPEDVPSPTFTLVQTYDLTKGSLWHADLYRLTSVSEIEELGLVDAFETDICLVEWPDRLAGMRPSNALDLTFSVQDNSDVRLLTAHWTAAKWNSKVTAWHR